jgi:hypothetical protein
LYLLLTGALAQTTVAALLRRDAPSLLAMGIATLVAGHVADLPRPLLIWGCAIMLLILIAALIGMLARLALDEAVAAADRGRGVGDPAGRAVDVRRRTPRATCCRIRLRRAPR